MTTCLSKTSVGFQLSTWHYIPESIILSNLGVCIVTYVWNVRYIQKFVSNFNVQTIRKCIENSTVEEM